MNWLRLRRSYVTWHSFTWGVVIINAVDHVRAANYANTLLRSTWRIPSKPAVLCCASHGEEETTFACNLFLISRNICFGFSNLDFFCRFAESVGAHTWDRRSPSRDREWQTEKNRREQIKNWLGISIYWKFSVNDVVTPMFYAHWHSF